MIVDARIASSSPDLVCMSTTNGVHRAPAPRRGWWTTRSGPSATIVEVVVGDERGDLDDHVLGRVEPGHLEVHPHQHGGTQSSGSRTLDRCSTCPSSASTPSCRCRPTPATATPASTSWPAIDVAARAGGGRALVPTGVAVAIPPGYAGFVLPRSGLALRHGVTVLNTPGLIDAGYRDELQVILVNTDPSDAYEVHRGDRIAQLVVQRGRGVPARRRRPVSTARTAAAASATPAAEATHRGRSDGRAMRPASRQAGGVRLAHDVARVLVVAQPEEAGLAHDAVEGPLGEGHLAHQLRAAPSGRCGARRPVAADRTGRCRWPARRTSAAATRAGAGRTRCRRRRRSAARRPRSSRAAPSRTRPRGCPLPRVQPPITSSCWRRTLTLRHAGERLPGW